MKPRDNNKRMEIRRERNHLERAMAVFILIHVSTITGSRFLYTGLRLPRPVCDNRAAGLYIAMTNISCSNHDGFHLNGISRCGNRADGGVICNLREGINTIIGLAESTCSSDSVSISDGRLVTFDKTVNSYRFCPNSYKVGHFNIDANDARPVPFRWSVPGSGQCNPRFVVACF